MRSGENDDFVVFLSMFEALKGRLRNDYICILTRFLYYENYDIALAMSSSRADPVLGHCPGWEYLNIYISVTALAGSI